MKGCSFIRLEFQETKFCAYPATVDLDQSVECCAYPQQFYLDPHRANFCLKSKILICDLELIPADRTRFLPSIQGPRGVGQKAKMSHHSSIAERETIID